MSMNRRKPRITLSVAFATLAFATGAVLFGHGLYIHAKAQLAQVLLAKAFLSAPKADDGTRHATSAKPWPWADIEPVARIEVPRLGASQIVLNDVSGEALAFGPGHVPGTVRAGEYGTAVYSAHRDTHFSWLKHVKPGDEVLVRLRDGDIHRYAVRRAWIARFDAPGITQSTDEKRIALTTCWPFDAVAQGDMRYIVEAVAVAPGKQHKVRKRAKRDLPIGA